MKQIQPEALVAFNQTYADYPRNKTLIELFEEQVTQRPDQIVLIFKNATYTYKHLNETANQLAHYLRSTYNINKDDVIGIKLERSEWMIITILAVLKAGAAYMPIDPNFQQERIDYMVSNSQCKILIDSVVLQVIKQQLSTYESRNPEMIAHPKSLAYVIYTSGSTGRPKGVMVEHQGVINRIEWMCRQYNYSSNDVILQKTTYTFDVSVWEIFMPLCWGTKMVLCEKEDIASPQRILALIQKHKVTCLHFVPSMLNVFISTLFDNADIKALLTSLRAVITSGEALPVKTVQNWYDKVDIPIHNLYGPTEASVDVTHYTTQKGDTRIPIGKPIWNTQIHIVDESHNLVPIGEMGEICIAGEGLARGYINRPELTAERFVPNPFAEEQRMYKTGDYGRWLPDGNIEYLGRKDDQVKIRGYRIELGEIEKVMGEHPGIDQCVVISKAYNDNSRLVAYYTPKWQYIKEREAELYNRQVANWKELFESEYEKTEDKEDVDEEFNFIGWGDSFTGQLIPADHMREWLNDIIDVIKAEQPQNVLEIGCGTGMIYYQLAGGVKKYIGTDISSSGINQIKKRISKGLRDYGPTELKVCAAHEITLDKDEKVDTIILNSIVQFFSGEEYLTKVIEKCIALLNGRGRIVIGDVRDYRLLEAFKARLQMPKVDGNVSVKEFKDDIEHQVLKEEEICYAPDYFYSLPLRFPAIDFVDIQAKQGDHINELTLYRYNVVLHVGIEKQKAQPTWKDWSSIKGIQQVIDQMKNGESLIALQGVPNFRLGKERLLQLALQENTAKNVRELAAAIEGERIEDADVREILRHAKVNGYHTRFLLHNDPYKYNVVLEKKRSDIFIEPLYQSHNNSQLFTNIPLFNDINALLQIEVKEHLGKYLPEYMVPSALVALRQIPLNANGKADKKALPDIRLSSHPAKSYVAPRNKIERLIGGIWEQLLGIEKVGAFDNFFDLGGNSLMAVQVMARLEKELGAKLPLAILFQHPTVQKLADVFLSQHHTINWNSLVALKPTGNKVPLYFVHGANGDVLFLRPFTTQVHPEQPIYALRPPGINGQSKLLDSIEEMATLYVKEILNHNPCGPYALSGYSFGGYVAFEMARQLKALGKDVKMVAIFDSDALRCNHDAPFLLKLVRKISYPFLRAALTANLLRKDFKGQWAYEKDKAVRWLSLQKRKLLNHKQDYHYYRYALEWKCKRARDKYKIKPLDISIELFRAKTRTFHMFDPQYLGWKKFALKGVNIHEVPGAHHLIFTPPNGSELGQMLQYCLDKAMSETRKENIVVIHADAHAESQNKITSDA